MISSIVWLILLDMEKIDSDCASWEIYLPIAFVEVVVYLFSLPKIADWLDKLRGGKNDYRRN